MSGADDGDGAALLSFCLIVVSGIFLSRGGWRPTSSSEAEDLEQEVVAVSNRGLTSVPETKEESQQSLHPSVSQVDLTPRFKRIREAGNVTVTYVSTTGTCRELAERVKELVEAECRSAAIVASNKISVQLATVESFDWWDELINVEDAEDESSSGLPSTILFILPTWTDGRLPPTAEVLLQSLEEIGTDWRIAPRPLAGRVQFAAFGIGSSAYDSSTMGRPAKLVTQWMGKLGARRMANVAVGDVEVGHDVSTRFHEWSRIVMERLRVNLRLETASKQPRQRRRIVGRSQDAGASKRKKSVAPSSKLQPLLEEEKKSEDASGASKAVDTCASDEKSSPDCCSSTRAESSCGCQSADANDEACCSAQKEAGIVQGEDQEEDYDDDDDEFDEEEEEDYDDDDEEADEPDVMDMEDIGNAMKAPAPQVTPNQEMVTPRQAAALKKEGYKLIGTHSAVKLCRWTKHQLRGRGGCYKHTFYGITSYQCMEATPSLACANKCVFCWRHHKNPVGREWRWKTDDPHFIVEEAIKAHISMIKEAKGIPGVKKDRWAEAHTVRHCALSLVGEPIMYPRIDEFLADLHQRHISSFLVTNGQHPDAIESLRPVTQLYVSVDAPTQESLIEIDRPLFSDAWERLRRSLGGLRTKGQRTVARLTVVKGWNSDEVDGYARLIALGHCSLVEVKGVTFCGKSDASNLNMSNTPWHHEVVTLTKTLQQELQALRSEALARGDEEGAPPEYGLACEHKHSCSVLLARVDQFTATDAETGERRWRTWIDYDRFHELAARQAADPTFSFDVTDYIADTPSWALFGANEEGFDPMDVRHRKKKKHPLYTQFDADGVPTHDHNGVALAQEERERLRRDMEKAIAKSLSEDGSVTTMMTSVDGEKTIQDARLMYRGLVMEK